MTIAQLVDPLWVVACVAQFVWAARLYVLGLVNRYRILFVYLIASGMVSIARLALGIYAPKELFGIPNPIGWFWTFCAPVMWAMEFCLLVDLATRLVEHYKGLRRFGQIMISLSAAVTVAIFLAMTVLDVSIRTWYQFWRAQTKAVDLSLAGLCFLLVITMTFFRLPVSKNVRITVGVLGVLAALNLSFTLGGTIWEQMAPAIRPLLFSIIAIVVYGGAACLFSRAGEEPSVKLPPVSQYTSAQAGATLKEVNESLVKVLRS